MGEEANYESAKQAQKKSGHYDRDYRHGIPLSIISGYRLWLWQQAVAATIPGVVFVVVVVGHNSADFDV